MLRSVVEVHFHAYHLYTRLRYGNLSKYVGFQAALRNVSDKFLVIQNVAVI